MKVRSIKAALLAAVLVVPGFVTSPAQAAVAPEAQTVMGQGGNFGFAAPTTTATGMNNPNRTALDEVRHRLFVADTNNNRVLVFNLNADNTLPDDTADNVIGQTNFTSNGTSNTSSNLNGPGGIAYDKTRDLLFVSNEAQSRILVFNTSTITNGMSAVYVIGQTDFVTATAGTTQSTLRTPGDVLVDTATSRLFVADNDNHRVLVFDLNSLATGMNAFSVFGQSSYTTRTAALSQTGMTRPYGLAFDPATKRLFVADQNNHRVTVWDMNNLAVGMSASNVLGQVNFTNGAAVATQSGMNSPRALSFSGSKLYVSDLGNSRILIFDTTTITNGMNASSVLGQPDFSSTPVGTSASKLYFPRGVTVDSQGLRAYVADTNNNRVLIFNLQTKYGETVISGTVNPNFTFTVAGRNGTCNSQTATGFQAGSTATAVDLGTLTPASTGGGAQDLTIASNAANGFVVYLRTSGITPDAFRTVYNNTVADVPGTRASPGAAPVAGTPGFGYTTNDTSTAFTSNTWAKLTSTNDSVLIGGAGTTAKTGCVGYQAAIATTTAAGSYSANIVYTAIPTF